MVASLWRQVVQASELWAKIQAFHEGWPQDLVPFLNLAKPRYSVRPFQDDSLIEDSPIDGKVAHNHSILSPWLAVHGTTGLSRLFSWLQRMVEIVLVDAVAHGNLAVLAYLHASFDLLSFDDRLLDLAAHFGRLEALQYLNQVGHPGCTKMAIDEAALFGHLGVIEWLCLYRDEGFSVGALLGACRNGHVDVLDWLHHQDGCMHRIASGFQLYLCEAAGKGHLDVVLWFRLHRPHDSMPLAAVIESYAASNQDGLAAALMDESNVQSIFNLAVMGGDLSMAKELYQRLVHTFGAASIHRFAVCWPISVVVAATRGHVAMVQWWYLDNVATLRPHDQVFGSILQRGTQAVVAWLLVAVPRDTIAFESMLQTWKEESASFSARMGDMRALKRHVESGQGIEADVMMEAASGGHLALARLLHRHGIDPSSIGSGFMSGRLDMVQFLWSAWQDLVAKYGEEAFHSQLSPRHFQTWSTICSFGDVRLVEFLIKHNRAIVPPEDIYIGAVLSSLPLLRYLVATLPPEDPAQVLLEAADTGYLPSIRFLLDQYPTTCSTDVMDGAACQGHLNVVKFLHQDPRCPGCTHAALDDAAKWGCLDVVQWLHENRREGCSERAMTDAAARGHLHMVQWLAVHRTEGNYQEALKACWHDPVRVYLQKLIDDSGTTTLANSQELTEG
ncbi:Aste57867_9991 [Aphanomyces stellatus]|uniref:Aste57867_9991 protein n=1 Tax=Aphanomyces stellatus TaxID=120398 RepID=A0A485KQ53_9STRA|nr:hypothetical protein As57867_009952 [Aphanomyces stellatus]VFT86869.1 Aste57867_9991 [Aphanomyces stellatus]